METVTADLEGRVRTLFYQFQVEGGILERVVYKGRNQHRRCPYFRSLLKVRSDVRLLQSAGLQEILNAVFPIIEGKRPAKAAMVRKRLKKDHSGGSHSYLGRLLGVARLLAQMAEPILKAGYSQISFLLSKNFFTLFSVSILALLGRFRALVEQILVDIVTIYNKVASFSQNEQTSGSSHEGAQVLGRFHPAIGPVPTLECVRETDKLVLRESFENRGASNLDMQEFLPTEALIKLGVPFLSTKVGSSELDRDPDTFVAQAMESSNASECNVQEDLDAQNFSVAEASRSPKSYLLSCPDPNKSQKRPRVAATPLKTASKKTKSGFQQPGVASTEEDSPPGLLAAGTLPRKHSPGYSANRGVIIGERSKSMEKLEGLANEKHLFPVNAFSLSSISSPKPSGATPTKVGESVPSKKPPQQRLCVKPFSTAIGSKLGEKPRFMQWAAASGNEDDFMSLLMAGTTKTTN